MMHACVSYRKSALVPVLIASALLGLLVSPAAAQDDGEDAGARFTLVGEWQLKDNHTACFGPNLELLAYIGRDGQLRVVDFQKLTPPREFHDDIRPHKKRCALSPDARHVVSATEAFTWKDRFRGSRLVLWEVETGKRVRELGRHRDGVNSLVFSPDGKTLASGGYDHVVQLFDVATGRVKATYTLPIVKMPKGGQTRESPHQIVFDPSAQRLFIIGHSSLMEVSLSKRKDEARILHVFEYNYKWRGAALNPDLTQMVWCWKTDLGAIQTSDGSQLWKHTTGCIVPPLCYTPEAGLLVDGELRLWQVARPELSPKHKILMKVGTLPTEARPQKQEWFARSADGKRFAALDLRNMARVWQLTSSSAPVKRPSTPEKSDAEIAAEVKRLMAIAESANFRAAADAMNKLGEMGPKAKAALPVLRRVRDTKGKHDTVLGRAAKQAIARIEGDDTIAVEIERLLVIARTRRSRVAGSALTKLGKLGPKAKSALPAIRQIRDTRGKNDEIIHRAAEQAIARIEGKVEEKRPSRRPPRGRGRR